MAVRSCSRTRLSPECPGSTFSYTSPTQSCGSTRSGETYTSCRSTRPRTQRYVQTRTRRRRRRRRHRPWAVSTPAQARRVPSGKSLGLHAAKSRRSAQGSAIAAAVQTHRHHPHHLHSRAVGRRVARPPVRASSTSIAPTCRAWGVSVQTAAAFPQAMRDGVFRRRYSYPRSSRSPARIMRHSNRSKTSSTLLSKKARSKASTGTT